jgi:hypothetical protein
MQAEGKLELSPGSNPSHEGHRIQMTQADSVLSTPPTNTSAIDHPMMFPPRDPTPQAGGEVMAANRELTLQDVLADLLGSGDFPAQVLDPEAAAWITLRRLFDAGFEVVPAGS